MQLKQRAKRVLQRQKSQEQTHMARRQLPPPLTSDQDEKSTPNLTQQPLLKRSAKEQSEIFAKLAVPAKQRANSVKQFAKV